MSKLHPFDYFFLLRPLILLPSWNFLLIGSYLARGKGGFTFEIFIGLIIYTCVMGGVYILNQIMDVKTDQINKKLFLLAEGAVSRKSAYIEMVILWCGAVFLSLRFGFLFFIFIIISILLGVLYSLPPVKLKGKPLLDTLANGIGYGMVNFAVGWLLVQPFDPAMFHRFIPYVLSISAVFINTTIVDLKGDQEAGESTTAVFLGPRAAYILSTILLCCAVITAVKLKDPICLIPAASSLPLFIYLMIHSFFRKEIKRRLTIASFRLPGLLFTLITAFLYPPYILLLLIMLVGMRLYYKKRFGIIYPTLSQG